MGQREKDELCWEMKRMDGISRWSVGISQNEPCNVI